MNENTKSALFVGAALLTVAAALAMRPQSINVDAEADSRTGQNLVKSFDPEQAKRLRITRFDEDTATLSEFEVASREGVWTLPSKGGYPADAQQQMGEAAAGVMDRQVLRIASKLAADHAEYGVIDPKSPKLEVGQSGVGLRVAMLDERNDPLIDVIIGKQVKGAENQRFVRLDGQDIVYVCEIDPSKFSTKFEDWIEADLLKINTWDLAQVDLKNYSASAELSMTPDGRIVPRLIQKFQDELALIYDDASGKWSPKRLAIYDPASRDFKLRELAEDEELDNEKLTALKTALDDLQIVDVERKPEGLSGSLKAGGDFLKDRQTIESLARRGFLAAGGSDGGIDLISSEGEFVASMKDGVEYVLRFGGLQTKEGEASDPAAEAAPGDDESSDSEAAVNRYLFVMARFNPALIASPELQDLPELPEGAATEPAKEEADKEASADDKAEPDAAKDEAKDNADGEAQDTGDKKPEETELDRIVAERKSIEESNQRLLDAYKEKVDSGKERVQQLNDRFGDWYYVISNSVYEKVHVTVDGVLKKKEKKAGEETTEQPPTDPAAAALQGLPGLDGIGGAPSEPSNEAAPAEQPASEATPEEEATAAGSEASTPSDPSAKPDGNGAAPATETPATEAAAP